MSTLPDLSRRRLLAALACSGLEPAFAARAGFSQDPTPSQLEGPFYPLKLPLDHDNDLTRVRGQTRPAHGIITDVYGVVHDADGQPIAGARVEIWQCDARGFYHHPHDRGGRADPGFQGFGRSTTDAAGRYRFRTLRPVAYPGRTPHIHYKVMAPGAAILTTQLYIAGEARNASDGLWQRVPAAQRARVQAAFMPQRGGHAEQSARFDLILAGRDGTPRA